MNKLRQRKLEARERRQIAIGAIIPKESPVTVGNLNIDPSLNAKTKQKSPRALRMQELKRRNNRLNRLAVKRINKEAS